MGVRRTLSASDRALLERLLRNAGPRVFGYIRKAFGPAIDAEELTAETFARAADNVVSLRTCARPDLYLLTIARNLGRDRFRRKTPDAAPTDAIVNQRPVADDPGARMDEADDRRRFLEAVERLPEAQREIVVLRISAELKFEEIAAMLAIPLGTALSRMNAALRSLRKQLGCVYVR